MSQKPLFYSVIVPILLPIPCSTHNLINYKKYVTQYIAACWATRFRKLPPFLRRRRNSGAAMWHLRVQRRRQKVSAQIARSSRYMMSSRLNIMGGVTIGFNVSELFVYEMQVFMTTRATRLYSQHEKVVCI